MSIRYNWCKSGRSKGAFSLIELLIVIAVFSILVTVSVPSIQSTLQKSYFYFYRDRLLHMLYVTKSLAILRQSTLEICGSSDEKDCDDGWTHSWLIRDVKSQRILRRIILNPTKTLQIEWRGNHASRHGIYFNKWGGTSGQQGRITLNAYNHMAQMVLILSGRIRLS